MKQILFFLVFVSVAWSRISIEILPQPVEKGKEFTFALVVPMRELPGKYNFPQIPRVSDNFILIKKEEKNDTVSDFFNGTYKVRKFTFTLKPKKSGRLSVGPILWNINGRKQNLGVQHVDVKRSLNAAGLYVRASIPLNKKYYVGEQIPLSVHYSLYYNAEQGPDRNPKNFGQDFAGSFAQSEIKWVKSNKPDVYASAKQKGFITAMRAGKVKFPSLEYSYKKRGRPKEIVEENRKGNFYSKSVRTERQSIAAKAKTKPISLTIKSLPTGAPADFDKWVGSYKLNEKIDRDTLKVGEAITYTLRIQGDGRPGIMPDLKFPKLPDFRTVPPEISTKTKIVNQKIRTTRTYKFFLYPKREGQFTLPIIGFTSFNPASKKYVEHKSKGLGFYVDKGVNTYSESTLVSKLGPSVQTEASDIRYIKTYTDEYKIHNTVNSYWLFVILWIITFITYPALIYFDKKRAIAKSDIAGIRKSKSKSMAYKRLEKAKIELPDSEFYKTIMQSVQGYLSDTTNLEFIGMTQIQSDQVLQDKGLHPDIIQEINNLFEICEMAQFGGVAGAKKDNLDFAANLLQKLEKSL